MFTDLIEIVERSTHTERVSRAVRLRGTHAVPPRHRADVGEVVDIEARVLSPRTTARRGLVLNGVWVPLAL